MISREIAWSLKHQRIDNVKDHQNVKIKYRGLISTTARTEEKIMIATEGEETTEIIAISQDLPTQKMNAMKTKKIDSTQRTRAGNLKVNGEVREGRRITFTTTTTRSK